MNAKARAVLSPDGKSWILNGEKMWLTNAGFADVYITFAKVDGEHFTAFIIDKGTPGVSLGAEEKKTGIKGTSTRPLILHDAVIPRENLLGEIGKGHKIAFNILNIGRFKLGAGVTGGAKLAHRPGGRSTRKARTAFGQPISDFGLIKHKLGEMAILAYVSESMVYRTAGHDRPQPGGRRPPGHAQAALKRIEEYDVECSMVKVWCSEMLDYVVDETVQIFGGAGYVEDYPAERYWRDARVNRIFEGTNEINRLLVPGRLHPPRHEGRAARLPEGDGAHGRAHGAALAARRRRRASWPRRRAWCAGAKKVALMCLGLAVQKFGAGADRQQEVLGHFADIAMETYALESAVLRTQKRAAAGGRGRVPRAGGGRALLRPGRPRPHRGLGAPAAGRGRRGRHAAHLPGGAQALHQARDARHGRPAPPGRRGRRREGGLPVLSRQVATGGAVDPARCGPSVPYYNSLTVSTSGTYHR